MESLIQTSMRVSHETPLIHWMSTCLWWWWLWAEPSCWRWHHFWQILFCIGRWSYFWRFHSDTMYSRTPLIRPPSESHWCGRIRGMVAREGFVYTQNAQSVTRNVVVWEGWSLVRVVVRQGFYCTGLKCLNKFTELDYFTHKHSVVQDCFWRNSNLSLSWKFRSYL